jgi:S-adenosylmethionine-diacylgycerolhomoserine-N-methlytransferase
MTAPNDACCPHPAEASPDSAAALTGYYRWHARLYDATRWSFLFGRTALIQSIARLSPPPRRILEIGCGTGSNLLHLRRQFPNATITGLDLSADMLARARRKLAAHPARIALIQGRYDQPLDPQPAFDLIVFSYCLSMIDPGWERAVDSALRDLRPGGRLAVVDFHETRFHAFQRWMAVNHVRMDGHLLPCLNAHCQPLLQTPGVAYGGLWRYFRFIGQKRDG